MRRTTLRKLKALRHAPVPPEVLEAGRRKLDVIMAEFPMAPGGFRFRAILWKPAMYAAAVAVFVATTGGAAYAAQDALPGDALYTVKLAAEDVQERLALSPERKFVVQAAHAAKRLEETHVLLQRAGLDRKERTARVRKAISGYEDRLAKLDAIAAKMADGPDAPHEREGRLKAVQAAERVLDRHVDLVASATASEPETAESVLEPIEGSVKFEQDVFLFADRSAHGDGKEADDAAGASRELDERRKERGERLIDHVERLREGLRHRSVEAVHGM